KDNKQADTLLSHLKGHIAKDNKQADTLLSHLKGHIAKDSKNANLLVHLLKDYDYYERMSMRPKDYKKALKDMYKSKTGQNLDLDNPQTFSEKMYWLRLYDNTSLKSRLACKYSVRDYVKEKIGEEFLIPLLGVWDNFDDIDFNKLPDKFVLKCTHGWDMNIIVQDKGSLDLWDARYKINSWLRYNHAFGDLQQHMKIIPPKIIAEEYMENTAGDLYDYKFWCFNGEPLFVAFVMDRQKEKKEGYFDVDWNKTSFSKRGSIPLDCEVPKPTNLYRLVNLSKQLAEGLSFARIDLYVLNDGTVKFGEITFHPSGGINVWEPPEYDLILGEKLKLPIDNAEK
ncbi:MAG: hypothetical protein FWG65_00490, partial [Turicibacter sp.]|nr:hypothetical protein [Turicibacter sp.]